MFKKNIENLEFTITQKMYDQHDEEWETIKSGYSSRANLDSEYLEDYIIETVEDAYRIEGKDRYYACLLYTSDAADE